MDLFRIGDTSKAREMRRRNLAKNAAQDANYGHAAAIPGHGALRARKATAPAGR